MPRGTPLNYPALRTALLVSIGSNLACGLARVKFVTPQHGCHPSCYSSMHEGTPWHGNGDALKCMWRNCRLCDECAGTNSSIFSSVSAHNAVQTSYDSEISAKYGVSSLSALKEVSLMSVGWVNPFFRSLWLLLGGRAASTHPANGVPATSIHLLQQVSRIIPTTEQDECPSLFIVVLSRRNSWEQRAKLRAVWKHAGHGWGNVTVRFGVCVHPGDDEDGDVKKKLKAELANSNDVLLLHCEEGYTDGKLTRKVMASMSTYLRDFRDHELFMKTDDDTFVSTARLCAHLSKLPQKSDGFQSSYMGVFSEPDENPLVRAAPCRDPTNPWYEPKENYRERLYPPSAKGGPGYILSRTMVRSIMHGGIAKDNVLNNEDKAVGVWVDHLKRQGMDIKNVNLPGTDGYEQYHTMIKKRGRFGMYPYALHHHLEVDTILCLHDLEFGHQKEDISKCFHTPATLHNDTLPEDLGNYNYYQNRNNLSAEQFACAR